MDARNGSQPTQDYDKILPINASKTKTAALYARYSTDKQNERSIDDQFASCKRLYADRNGFKIVQTFSDAAKTSATMFNRDGLIKMMQAAERREFDVILAEGVDRIAGNSADMHSIYDRLEFCGVELHTVADGRVNDMHISFRGMANKQRLELVKRTVRRAHNAKAAEGKIMGGRIYGYAPVQHKPGEWTPNPAEVAVLLRIYREYAAGRKPRAILADLTREGIPSPGGGAWNFQALQGSGLRPGILSNPIYIGKLVRGRTQNAINRTNGKQVKRLTDPADWITAEVPHLRIIPQDLWDRVQAIRAARAYKKSGRRDCPSSGIAAPGIAAVWPVALRRLQRPYADRKERSRRLALFRLCGRDRQRHLRSSQNL